MEDIWSKAMRILRLIFTWWHGETLGTWLMTRTRGRQVGTDAQGNRYYEDKHAASINGKTRRWVVYHGGVEASSVPAEWHGWLHYTCDVPPVLGGFKRRAWHKPHRANLSGTPAAHQQKRRHGNGYHAWTPE